MRHSAEQAVAALRRADQAYYEQIAQVDALDFASAFTSGRFPASADCNQLREIALGGRDPSHVYESVERFYSHRSLACQRWVPALNEDARPFDGLLPARGWTRRDERVFAMVDWAPPAERAAGLRILPARAMRRALRATYLDPSEPRWDETAKSDLADEAEERLNDSNYDVFVAMLDDGPAGRVGYHEVGDIAAVRGLYVVGGFRGRGVGRALLDHVILMARRLSPRLLVTSLPEDDAAARRFVERAGFHTSGLLAEYYRSLA